MNLSRKAILKYALLAALCLSALITGITRLGRGLATGEEGAQVWFYDQSERELYAVPRDTIPPHEGVGGTAGDGVRAIVVAPATDCNDQGKRRIAYLETCTPELKQLNEGLRAARAAGTPYGKPIPGGESSFFDKNTLVRGVDQPVWHDMTTPEARKLVNGSRASNPGNGAQLSVCAP